MSEIEAMMRRWSTRKTMGLARFTCTRLITLSVLAVTSLPAFAQTPGKVEDSSTRLSFSSNIQGRVSSGNQALVTSASPLVLLAEPGITDTRGSNSRYDFGTVNLLDAPVVSHTFTLQNSSHEPIHVLRVQGSCGCMAVVMEPAAGATAQPGDVRSPVGGRTLAPNATMQVRVDLDLRRTPPGLVVGKTAMVFLDGKSTPAAMLEMQGKSVAPVRFTPALLDFGAVKAGASVTRRVRVEFDARLLERGALPALISTKQAVTVQAVSAGKLDAVVTGSPATTTPKVGASEEEEEPIPSPFDRVGTGSSSAGSLSAQAKTVPVRWLSKEYDVTANGAATGQITADLRFVPASRQQGNPALSIWNQARVVLTGQIVGEVTAQPLVAAIGLVEPGKTNSCALELRGNSPGFLEGASFACGSPWIGVGLGDLRSAPATDGNSKQYMATLRVSVSDEAPLGSIRSELLITLKNGQKLIVPVTASVFPIPARLSAGRPGIPGRTIPAKPN